MAVSNSSAQLSTLSHSLPEPWSAVMIAVVVPTYQEAENLPILAARVLGLDLSRLHLIVVDDNSPDGTGQIADRIAEEANTPDRPDRVAVVHRPAKDGIGPAHIAGMRTALSLGVDFVVQMDADLSHQPEVIPEMLGTMLATGADLVIGSRYIVGGSLSRRWTTYRKLLSRGANIYMNAVLNIGVRDTTSGFKLWRADVLRGIGLDEVASNGFGFQIEMNHRCRRAGYKAVEIPIHLEERFAGRSKMDLGIQAEALLLPWRLKIADLRRRAGRTSS